MCIPIPRKVVIEVGRIFTVLCLEESNSRVVMEFKAPSGGGVSRYFLEQNI